MIIPSPRSLENLRKAGLQLRAIQRLVKADADMASRELRRVTHQSPRCAASLVIQGCEGVSYPGFRVERARAPGMSGALLLVAVRAIPSIEVALKLHRLR